MGNGQIDSTTTNRQNRLFWTQWLRALVALLGDPDLIPSAYTAGHKLSVMPVPEDIMPTSGF